MAENLKECVKAIEVASIAYKNPLHQFIFTILSLSIPISKYVSIIQACQCFETFFD